MYNLRFNNKILKTSTCWLWQGGKSKYGCPRKILSKLFKISVQTISDITRGRTWPGI